ncbi:flagellar export protein FliJ [Thermaerobacillus caldiproteolyticus]|uniref:flagellar export protein FliJ n=1 Tax=Thermaerobacillus caldiproteolyticus TaxID=247480 RepID=UPI00188C36F9|nr:flagellar export protein FliJ [Anoxybacillus caldiproteolyticus]QPA32051.1 flagellar biosynthesis chaperone FliJ [Anoxybacillus caldiproteolyticus]
MVYAFKFDKVLAMKEKEKETAISEYNEALKRFEEVAEKLYRCLKQKEDYERIHKQKLQLGLSIQDIRYFQQFMTNLERTIHHYQHLVIQAREQMQAKQAKLAELNIEVKKYEKMKEKHVQTVLQTIRANENKWMDEISIQQFANRRN